MITRRNALRVFGLGTAAMAVAAAPSLLPANTPELLTPVPPQQPAEKTPDRVWVVMLGSDPEGYYDAEAYGVFFSREDAADYKLRLATEDFIDTAAGMDADDVACNFNTSFGYGHDTTAESVNYLNGVFGPDPDSEVEGPRFAADKWGNIFGTFPSEIAPHQAEAMLTEFPTLSRYYISSVRLFAPAPSTKEGIA